MHLRGLLGRFIDGRDRAGVCQRSFHLVYGHVNDIDNEDTRWRVLMTFHLLCDGKADVAVSISFWTWLATPCKAETSNWFLSAARIAWTVFFDPNVSPS